MDRRSRRQSRDVLLALLREVRREAGLRQEEVAPRMGWTQATLSKVETGERRLDLLELRDLCAIYGIQLGTFVERLEHQLAVGT